MSSSQPDLGVETRQVGRELRGVITASIGGDEVGTLRFTDYEGTCQIDGIVVSPDHQRKGIATSLVARLREELPETVPAQFFLNPQGRALSDAIYDQYAKPLNDGRKDGTSE